LNAVNIALEMHANEIAALIRDFPGRVPAGQSRLSA
jgi:hypothetical protein